MDVNPLRRPDVWRRATRPFEDRHPHGSRFFAPTLLLAGKRGGAALTDRVPQEKYATKLFTDSPPSGCQRKLQLCLCELSCSDLWASICHSELSDCGAHQQAARESGLVGVVVRHDT